MPKIHEHFALNLVDMGNILALFESFIPFPREINLTKTDAIANNYALTLVKLLE